VIIAGSPPGYLGARCRFGEILRMMRSEVIAAGS
jgi:hypothetical protein